MLETSEFHAPALVYPGVKSYLTFNYFVDTIRYAHMG